MRISILLFLLLAAADSFAQSPKSRRLTDKVILNNGNSETGNVIQCDSNFIVLRRYDFSTQKIEWSSIDTICGLSHNTLFFEPSIGLGGMSYFSTFKYAKVNSSGIFLQAKMGRMRRKHWATYLQLTEMPVKPYNIFKTGLGFHYYLFKGGYTKNFCTYIGGIFEMNSIPNNKIFFNRGTHIGVEYYYEGEVRFFAQLSHQKTILNVHNGDGVTFNVGIRYSREFADRYNNLNKHKSLE